MSANDPRGWGHLSYASCSPSPSRKGRRTIWLYCVKGAWISTPHVPVNGRTVTPPKTASGGWDGHRLRPLKFTKNYFTNYAWSVTTLQSPGLICDDAPVARSDLWRRFSRPVITNLQINEPVSYLWFIVGLTPCYLDLFMPWSCCQLLISSCLLYFALHQFYCHLLCCILHEVICFNID